MIVILETFIIVCISENELFAYWVILYTFLLQNIFFQKISFMSNIRVSNSLDLE